MFALCTPQCSCEQHGRKQCATGLVAPHDSVNIYINASTKRPTKLEVQSAMNENPVQIVAEYRDLPNGPTYIARVTVDYPEAKLQLIIENFDYVSQR